MENRWQAITDAVHTQGGTIFMQLWHCGRAFHSRFHSGASAVAPSAIAINGDYIHTPNGPNKPGLTVWRFTPPTVICWMSFSNRKPTTAPIAMAAASKIVTACWAK